MNLFMIFKPAFTVQLKAALKGSLCKKSKGQSITMTYVFPILWEKCMGSLTSPANQ